MRHRAWVVLLCLVVAVSGMAGGRVGAAAERDPVPLLVASASWNSPATAWVLGTTGCTDASCTVVAGTSDAGATWAPLAAPGTPLAYRSGDGHGISYLYRADTRNGFSYYPELLTTHDGAHSWKPVPIPGGGRRAVSMVASGGYAYLAVNSCAVGDRFDCPTRAGLWRAELGSDTWQQLPVALGYSDFPQLTASDRTVYVTGQAPDGSDYLFSSSDGVHFDRRSSPCPASDQSLQLAPTRAGKAFLLCSENVYLGTFRKTVYVTGDGARTTAETGAAPEGGSPTNVAAQRRALLITVSGGDSHLLLSDDAGRTFIQPYTSATTSLDQPQLIGSTGSVVSGPSTSSAGMGQLLLSHDGGHTWTLTTVRA